MTSPSCSSASEGPVVRRWPCPVAPAPAPSAAAESAPLFLILFAGSASFLQRADTENSTNLFLAFVPPVKPPSVPSRSGAVGRRIFALAQQRIEVEGGARTSSVFDCVTRLCAAGSKVAVACAGKNPQHYGSFEMSQTNENDMRPLPIAIDPFRVGNYLSIEDGKFCQCSYFAVRKPDHPFRQFECRYVASNNCCKSCLDLHFCIVHHFKNNNGAVRVGDVTPMVMGFSWCL